MIIDKPFFREYSYAMDAVTKAKLFETGGQIASDLARAFINRPPPKPKAEAETTSPPVQRTAPAFQARTSNIALPTSEETTTELRRRLAKELYRMELDLAAGLKIAGKPCDCGSNKHTLMLEAAAEELISQDPGKATVYQSIIRWIRTNAPKIVPEAVQSGQYDSEYPRMANEFKMFRKEVLGSVAVAEPAGGEITLEDAKRMAAEEAIKEVERAWGQGG